MVLEKIQDAGCQIPVPRHLVSGIWHLASCSSILFFILHQIFAMLTVRVYGILLGPGKQVLVSDEYIRGHYYTKFPGGGLEPGEGTRDCLKREFMEEMNLEVSIGDHIYTTDFYQESAFRPGDQILSIYYFATALEPITVPLRDKPFDFDEQQLAIYKRKNEIETFRFVDWQDFSSASVTLPIDKIVADMVKAMSL